MKFPLHMARWPSVILMVIILGTVWLPRVPAQAANGRLDGALGPQLFRIKATPERQVELAAAGVVAHTRLADDSVLASGPSTAAAALQAAGIAFELLATDTRGQVYYLVDAQAPDAARLAARLGSIIYQDALDLLVAVPRVSEQTFVETLPAQGVALSLIHISEPTRPY